MLCLYSCSCGINFGPAHNWSEYKEFGTSPSYIVYILSLNSYLLSLFSQAFASRRWRSKFFLLRPIVCQTKVNATRTWMEAQHLFTKPRIAISKFFGLNLKTWIEFGSIINCLWIFFCYKFYSLHMWDT